MVSVVIPYYNNAPYVRKCVESVLNQTYENFEIIIVDDGSKDDLLTAIEGLNDQRLHAPIKLSHGGVSSARNAGIIRARGECIIFIDGDDWVEPNHIEILVTGLSQADMSMIEMVNEFKDHQTVNEKAHPLYSLEDIIRVDDFDKLFYTYLLSSPCNKIYRTNLLKGEKFTYFESSISYAEDLLFNLKYFKNINSVKLNPQQTYHYVKHEGSGTTRYHQNTVFIVQSIINAAGSLISNFSAQGDRMLMDLMLWGFKNINHPDSCLTSKEKVAAINMLLSLPALRKARKKGLPLTGISQMYRMLIYLDSGFLLRYALNLKK